MEDINKIGEQPDDTQVHAVATDIENGTEECNGSPLGKFKNSEKLLDAYNELQSEFTRKCQKLSETEKKLQDFTLENASTKESQKEEFAWKKNISEFLQSHKNASALMDDITNEIINDESLKDSEDGLEKAYNRVIEKKYVPYDELIKDVDFLNKYIYSNENIKNNIIKEYVSTLQKNQNPLVVSNSGFNRSASTGGKFTSLEDARAYVENMFR